MATTQSMIRLRPKFWAAIALAVLLAIWLGVPTFNKWRADRLVDELCAKDGGINVYETVTLPKERFNKYGQPEIRFKDYMQPSDSLYFSYEGKDLIGNSGGKDTSELGVWRSVIRLHRRSDEKVLGETVQYSRRGGDPVGPWHPSSHGCPINASEWDLAKKVLVKQDGR